jgi:hypothetical protein
LARADLAALNDPIGADRGGAAPHRPGEEPEGRLDLRLLISRCLDAQENAESMSVLRLSDPADEHDHQGHHGGDRHRTGHGREQPRQPVPRRGRTDGNY